MQAFSSKTSKTRRRTESRDVSRPQKAVGPKKRPITTEVSHFGDILRFENKRCTESKEKGSRKRYSFLRFETRMHRKTTENYLVTTSVKRMHLTKKSLSNISVSDLQSGIVSLIGSEFESLHHMAPHFTNYSDPLRSAGFTQVLTRRGNEIKRSSQLRTLLN